MKKIVLLTLLLCSLLNSISGQDNALNIGIYVENDFYFKSEGNYYLAGLQIERQIGKRWDLYYKPGIGVRPDGKVFGRLPLGVLLSGMAISSVSTSIYLGLGFVGLVIPEGVQFMALKKDNKQLKIYAGPLATDLGFEINKPIELSGEFGVRGRFIFKEKFSLNPYMGSRLIYSDLNPALQFGAAITYDFAK